MNPVKSASNKVHYDKSLFSRALILFSSLLALAACDAGKDSESAPETTPPAQGHAQGKAVENMLDARRQSLSMQAKELFGPIEVADRSAENQARIELGRMLYFEKRLSLENDISCNSCHGLNTFGVDNEPTSPGHLGQRGERNSPTVYNSALHIAQFWDGRAKDLTEQAKGPILNPVEMAMSSEGAVVTRIASIPGYVEKFEAAFPDDTPALTFDNLAAAVASFEAGLLTPTHFDSFMKGNLDDLNEAEVSGLELFIETGCASCHSGPALGGNMFQKMGLIKPYPTEDTGRFAVTGEQSDIGVFKVPSLRNVARTRPYFHDGSVTRLVDAIQIMAEYQLGKELSAADQASIAMFLESLTGTPDAAYITSPELPEESNTVPAGAS